MGYGRAFYKAMGVLKNRPKDEHRLSLLMHGALIYEAMAIHWDSLLHFGNPGHSVQVDQKQHELIDAYSIPLELCTVLCSILLCAFVCYTTALGLFIQVRRHNTNP